MQYTYYKSYGNTIFFSYIDDNGITHHSRINDYVPKLYTECEDEDTEWKSIYGKSLKPVEFENIKAAKDFYEQYKHVDGFKFHGNMNFAGQFCIELFEGDASNASADAINGCIIDIEVTAPEFPTPIEAKYEIDLLTCYSTKNKEFMSIGLYDYDKEIDETDAGKVKGTYQKCATEADLLRSFVQYIKNGDFHFTTGWNSSGFDMPYVVQRIEKVLGKSVLKTLSPYGIVNKRNSVDDYMNDVLKVDIVGLPDIDYMLMYKKHILAPRESYKLDYICRVELEKTKLDHSEEGSLFNLSHTNPQKYVSYNIIDVLRITELDEKINLIQLTSILAYYCMSNFHDTITTVPIWECLIAKELYKEGKVQLARQPDSSFREFCGGFVLDPQVGYHRWIISLDLNSLYPHIEMQVNISPETYIPHDELPEELLNLHNQLKVKRVEDYWIQCQNLVRKEVDLSVLKKYDVSMSACGEFFRRDIKGFIPEIKEGLYADRKKVKKNMLKYKQRLVELKDYAKEHEVELHG